MNCEEKLAHARGLLRTACEAADRRERERDDLRARVAELEAKHDKIVKDTIAGLEQRQLECARQKERDARLARVTEAAKAAMNCCMGGNLCARCEERLAAELEGE